MRSLRPSMLRAACGGVTRGAVRGAAAGAPVAAVAAAGAVRRCAAAANERRRLWRWGGSSALIARGAEDSEVSKEPLLFQDIAGVSSVACGSSHSAFVISGQLYTHGSNKYSQLGRTLAEGAVAPDPDEVPMGIAVKQASLGAYHSAVVAEDGSLWTWGWGGSFWSGAGAHGHGHKQTVEVPTKVEQFEDSGEKIKEVACGSQHTLVLTEEGRLYSTGKGDFGRLGHGDTSDEVEFKEIDYFFEANDSVLAPDAPPEIVRVGAGDNFSAAMSSSGELWVWGRNDHGQLGLGEEAMGDMYSAERYPRLIRSLPAEGLRIVDFACGEHHLVVLTDAGTLYEWGSRTWLEPHAVPVPSQHAESLKTIVKLAAGDKFSFALAADGTLFSWGSKASGCLAQGPDCPKTIVEPTPVPSSAFQHQKLVDVTASKSRCLAITLEDEYSA